MKIEIFVVQAYKDLAYLTYEEKQALDQLEQLKVELCVEFGGLTVIPNCKGYWVDNGKLERDIVDIWTIYSLTANHTYRIISDYAKKIKATCNQKSQLFVIDNMPHFI